MLCKPVTRAVRSVHDSHVHHLHVPLTLRTCTHTGTLSHTAHAGLSNAVRSWKQPQGRGKTTCGGTGGELFLAHPPSPASSNRHRFQPVPVATDVFFHRVDCCSTVRVTSQTPPWFRSIGSDVWLALAF